MPAVLMENLEMGITYLSGSESQSPPNWDKDQTGARVCQRRQRNRDAARKSRKKQTERADQLHEELQALEQSNAAYVKEIAELKKELQHYTTVLQDHEPQCTLVCWATPSVPNTASMPSNSTSELPQIIPSIGPEPSFMPVSTQDQISQFSLCDFLDRDEWHLDFIDI
ncbi:basic leucine zipper transcriptional factor ATF-like [Brachyhypopomus gauderio]|uniref:basic leucine zipper transcriptional factor ATF-like n=1 Tax=Brachyhypopomus gauderio TaxID=698409 RepID=UPI00404175BC